jgi:hypothetical protein
MDFESVFDHVVDGLFKGYFELLVVVDEGCALFLGYALE